MLYCIVHSDGLISLTQHKKTQQYIHTVQHTSVVFM